MNKLYNYHCIKEVNSAMDSTRPTEISDIDLTDEEMEETDLLAGLEVSTSSDIDVPLKLMD